MVVSTMNRKRVLGLVDDVSVCWGWLGLGLGLKRGCVSAIQDERTTRGC